MGARRWDAVGRGQRLVGVGVGGVVACAWLHGRGTRTVVW